MAQRLWLIEAGLLDVIDMLCDITFLRKAPHKVVAAIGFAQSLPLVVSAVRASQRNTGSIVY